MPDRPAQITKPVLYVKHPQDASYSFISVLSAGPWLRHGWFV